MNDTIEQLRARVEQACGDNEQLQIVGGGSKSFLGRTLIGTPLSTTTCTGMVSYEPTELVLTARAGTPLSEIEHTVGASGQMLAFEPPHFGTGATLGGAIASGLSGPRRPFTGSVRDFVLGVKIINGKGELLSFGGQVMKNVAGYDLSRLMTGAMGCLGVLVEASIKVLPRPDVESTTTLEMEPSQALSMMTSLGSSAVPLSGACYSAGRLHLRLAGTRTAVDNAMRKLGGEVSDGSAVWHQIRELSHEAFTDEPLWRASVPATTPHSDALRPAVIDWAGSLRWVQRDAAPQSVREWATQSGGHATLFRGGERDGIVYQPLAPPVLALHRELKRAFDPCGILNPGRMYAEI